MRYHSEANEVVEVISETTQRPTQNPTKQFIINYCQKYTRTSLFPSGFILIKVPEITKFHFSTPLIGLSRIFYAFHH